VFRSFDDRPVAPPCFHSRDENGFGFKSWGFLVFWWIRTGLWFYNFCLTGCGVDLIILFWTFSQLSVRFRDCRLLYFNQICEVWSVEFLPPVGIAHGVCWLCPVVQACSLCIMSSKLRNCCDFHWSRPFSWLVITIVAYSDTYYQVVIFSTVHHYLHVQPGL